MKRPKRNLRTNGCFKDSCWGNRDLLTAYSIRLVPPLSTDTPLTSLLSALKFPCYNGTCLLSASSSRLTIAPRSFRERLIPSLRKKAQNLNLSSWMMGPQMTCKKSSSQVPRTTIPVAHGPWPGFSIRKTAAPPPRATSGSNTPRANGSRSSIRMTNGNRENLRLS